MTTQLVDIVTSLDPDVRDRCFLSDCRARSRQQLLEEMELLEQFRKQSGNLYERVRASLFLHAGCRFLLQDHPETPRTGHIPPEGFKDLLERRFEQAIACFRAEMQRNEPNGTILSALAAAYHQAAFQALTDQVRKSVRVSIGNRWMFRVGHAEDHPVRVRKEMLQRAHGGLLYPILVERTPVRLDLSHSGWSDIFFLGMDYPEGARVLNISVDLGVYGRDEAIRPPVEAYVRVIPEPVLRLTSVDLEATKDVTDLRDLFNFGNDYLSLLKAGIIASGIVPPSFEGTGQNLGHVLDQTVAPGMGLELVTKVNDIPKGSRLAVSTNLLASMIAVLMRATGQTENLTGSLTEPERRLVASRAILGEWLGGSGGGWQDSGGVWPGFKTIEGVPAQEGDPEFGISRGTLLPRHRILGEGGLHPKTPERLTESLILFHGGMAQNVGPILEMVTEKYLLRGAPEWKARQEMRGIFDSILDALAAGDIQALARATTRNFQGPLQTIIPWASNHFTETVIARFRERAGDDYWGFQMLGGMSGGGMGVYVAPERQVELRDVLLDVLGRTKRELEDALPFAMDPVVYQFEIDAKGTRAEMLEGDEAVLPTRYYGIQIPELVRRDVEGLSYLRRAEFDHITARARPGAESHGMLRAIVGNLFRISDPASQADRREWDREADRIKRENGFDSVAHEQIRQDLRAGDIGLARNRLPLGTDIEDVAREDVEFLTGDNHLRMAGEKALRQGRVAVLTLAAGMGTRWTSGAGVVKAVNPFVRLNGRHRSFLEIHLAKSRRSARAFGTSVPHLISTSFLTNGAIEKHLALSGNYGYEGPLYLSHARTIAQRFIPMVRDLVFLWRETPQEILDEQKQKVRESVRSALMGWAKEKGEGSDYVDNLPVQRFNPPGHFYEVPNLLLNGVLARVLRENPNVTTLMLQNVDTLGASLDPEAVGRHVVWGRMLTYEVIPRRLSDRGGGLARVNGNVRLLEGLAQPREEDELRLSYYNSNTTWIEIDPLLSAFGLTRDDLEGPHERLAEAVRAMSRRVPTYVTIKDVKRRWGHGQEDVFPVAQVEKLWADMTSLSDVTSGFLVVPRMRGQQLKSPDELDPWNNDGSREAVEALCDFE